MQGVERGLLDYDEPVSRWIPEMESMEIISGPVDDFKLSKATVPVTLRQLVTHSSGVGYDAFQEPLIAWRKSRGEEPLTNKAKILDAHVHPLLFEPGQGWEYGAGLDLAGLAVARANKTTLEEYFQENIFKPVGMTQTTFHLTNKPGLKEKLVNVVQRTETGGLQDIGPILFSEEPADESGGAGLVSTPNDYMKLLVDVISDSPKVLKKESIEALFKPQFEVGSASHKAISETYVGIGQFSILGEGARNHALGGFFVPEDLPIGKTRNTMAWAGVANWVWFANRDLGIAGLYSTHIMPPGDPESVALVNEYIKEIFRRVS